MTFLTLKGLHILSAILLFGTGLGSTFYKCMADRSCSLETIAATNRHVVLADWLFTTPTVFLQPLTGILIAKALGISLLTPWLLTSILLYFLAGACWLPVVVLQIRMRTISQNSFENYTALPEEYFRYARYWFWLGIPAFLSMIAIVFLMVFRTTL